MNKMKKPIYFYLKFLLIIIIIFIGIFSMCILNKFYVVPVSQKDNKPGDIIPTWEDCFDRLNSNPLVKDIRWDEDTKICSVLQTVNTNTGSRDSLNPCSSYDDSCPVSNTKYICKNGQIQEKPTYWYLNKGTGECNSDGCDSIGTSSMCFNTEEECKKNRKDCTDNNNCSGVTNGSCNFQTGKCDCKADGTRDPNNCNPIGAGICSSKYQGVTVPDYNACNPGYHYQIYNQYGKCRCMPN